MINKKIVSLGLTCALAVSPLSLNRVSALEHTSTQINSGTKVEDSEEYKLLEEKFEKCIKENDEISEKCKLLEEKLKDCKKEKSGKKLLNLVKSILLKLISIFFDLIPFGVLVTIFSAYLSMHSKSIYADKKMSNSHLRNIFEKVVDYSGFSSDVETCPKILRPLRNYGDKVVELLKFLEPLGDEVVENLKSFLTFN